MSRAGGSPERGHTHPLVRIHPSACFGSSNSRTATPVQGALWSRGGGSDERATVRRWRPCPGRRRYASSKIATVGLGGVSSTLRGLVHEIGSPLSDDGGHLDDGVGVSAGEAEGGYRAVADASIGLPWLQFGRDPKRIGRRARLGGGVQSGCRASQFDRCSETEPGPCRPLWSADARQRLSCPESARAHHGRRLPRCTDRAHWSPRRAARSAHHQTTPSRSKPVAAQRTTASPTVIAAHRDRRRRSRLRLRRRNAQRGAAAWSYPSRSDQRSRWSCPQAREKRVTFSPLGLAEDYWTLFARGRLAHGVVVLERCGRRTTGAPDRWKLSISS